MRQNTELTLKYYQYLKPHSLLFKVMHILSVKNKAEWRSTYILFCLLHCHSNTKSVICRHTFHNFTVTFNFSITFSDKENNQLTIRLYVCKSVSLCLTSKVQTYSQFSLHLLFSLRVNYDVIRNLQ